MAREDRFARFREPLIHEDLLALVPGFETKLPSGEEWAPPLAPALCYGRGRQIERVFSGQRWRGNRPVATVHDGFATLATDARHLARIFWEEMLALYAQPVGKNLEAQFRAQCQNIPPFPVVNTLPDIGATLPQPLR